MKRRDFILASLMGSCLIFFNPLAAFGKKRGWSDPLEVDDCFYLPESPEAYSSPLHIVLKKRKVFMSKKEMIHGVEGEKLILSPGSYTFQYLGDHYGWYVV